MATYGWIYYYVIGEVIGGLLIIFNKDFSVFNAITIPILGGVGLAVITFIWNKTHEYKIVKRK